MLEFFCLFRKQQLERSSRVNAVPPLCAWQAVLWQSGRQGGVHMMRLASKIALVFVACAFVALALAAPAGAGWDEGMAAFERDDYERALSEFQALADQGDADGQVGLALMYAEGYGVVQDHVEAARWYRLAAQQGNAAGQFKLGDLYLQGLGVAEDYVEAALWIDRAARQGYLEAQLNIAVMHALGEGVPVDLVQAYAWFALATAQASPEAVGAVHLVSGSLSDEEIAEAVAMAEAMLAEHGIEPALGDLPALDVSAPLGARGNPVRVDGPSGEHEYLGRLRCLEGDAPMFERLGSVGEGPYGSILDVYDLRCTEGDRSAQVYMDMYHPDVLVDFPVPGFTLAPGQ